MHGGHIVRSTGRKDRHSKVCTVKGLRDRRVRLSAHTAIQFYDVQDRLGYDRPSKAVDWLIKNAKDAIDELDTLPAWNPNISLDFQGQQPGSSNFVTPPLDSVNYAPELLSRTSSHVQDLRLSLQSFQDPTPTNIFAAGSVNLPFDSNLMIPWHVADNNESQFFTQGGPLQSSNFQMHHSLFNFSSPSVQNIGFGSTSVDFSGFCVPTRMQGKEEHDDDVSDKPDPASHY